MRRLALPLLTALAVVGAVVPAAAAQSPAPTPTATASSVPLREVTEADDGRTVTLLPGHQLRVRLAPQGGAVWRGLDTGGPTLHVLAWSSSEQAGLVADLEALSAGRHGGSSTVRPQRLAAELVPACALAEPACPQASRTFAVDVVVEDGPPVTAPLACSPTARPTVSAAPGAVFATAGDDGRTVRVPRDGSLTVVLDGCSDPVWTAPRADALLFRASAEVDRRRGTVGAVFRPQALGTTTVTAALDARCLHRTDAAGDGECAVAQRAYSLTVEVTTPSSPSPCAKPVYEAFRVSPLRVAAGDAVEVAGGRDDLCVDDAQEPERAFTLLARPQGGSESVVETVRARFFRSTVRPTATTTYRLLMDGQEVRPLPEGTTVVVDRVSGSCATGLALTGPARAVAGSTVRLSGRAPAGEQVQVLFRRYGEAAYTVRRTLLAGPDGSFSTTWAATDDHRWYARTARCDTPAGLTKAAPQVLGPAVVRRGETVVLRVTAVAGVRTTVFFRGAGEPFSARRTLSGPGTVSYVAQSDQRYYALTRDTLSDHGLTQVR